MDKKELCSFVTTKLSEKPDSRLLTPAYISRKSGVPKATISRVKTGEVSSLHPDNAYSLLTYLLGLDGDSASPQSQALEMMQSAYPDWYERKGAYFTDSRVTSGDDQMQWSSLASRILDLSGTPRGLSQEFIINEYGKSIGLALAERMRKKGILEKRDGCYFSKTMTDTNAYSAQSQMLADLSEFEFHRVGEGPYLERISGCYSKENATKLRNMLIHFLSDYRRVEKNSLPSEADSDQELVRFTMNIFGDFEEAKGTINENI